MARKTHTQIERWLDGNRHRLDGPEQTYGDEPGSTHKDFDTARTRTLMAACWAYEQAAGNQAIPLIYQTVNEHLGHDGTAHHLMERSYWPAVKGDLTAYENAGIPIYGVESKHQMLDYDIVATSISYPVLSVNLVKMLLMSDVPPTWADRTDSAGATHAGRRRDPGRYPMVMCGGQATGAPEVVANIVDCWFVGEVEDEPGNPGLGAVLDRVGAMRASGRWAADRLSCYDSLALEFDFLYFPHLHRVVYGYEERESVAIARAELEIEGETMPSRQVQGVLNVGAQRGVRRRRFVKDLSAAKGLTRPPVLYTNPGLGGSAVEVSRGCPAWCHFCSLTYQTKPYRQRDVESSARVAAELVRNTGATFVSPFGPDFPMHTEKMSLIERLLETVTDEVDASSMRVDDFLTDPRYVLLSVHGGMDGITLGVEGNSARMRDSIGKGIGDEDIKEAVARALNAGIGKIKLYMISNLPGETEHDIYKILALAVDLAKLRDQAGSRARIQFSWTPLLIEGHTPLQWFAPTGPNYALGDAFEELKGLGVEFKLGGKSKVDRATYFQLSQRASREVGMALVEAVAEMNVGCWGGAPRGLANLCRETLVRRGFLNELADVYDERDRGDLFGWEMVDSGVQVGVLWDAYRKQKNFIETTDPVTYDEDKPDGYHGTEWIPRCDERCQGAACGACDATDLGLRRAYIGAAARESRRPLRDVAVVDERSVAHRVRARITTSDARRQVGADHWRAALRRAANITGLPVTKRGLDFASDLQRFRDWSSGADYVEFGLRRGHGLRAREALQAAVDRLNGELGEHMAVGDFQLRAVGDRRIREQVDLVLHEVEIPTATPDRLLADIRRWNATDHVPVWIREEGYGRPPTRTEVNGREVVRQLWAVGRGSTLAVRFTADPRVGPYAVVPALTGNASWSATAAGTARRLEMFLPPTADGAGFLDRICDDCGHQVPRDLLDRANGHLCPRCADRASGLALADAQYVTA